MIELSLSAALMLYLCLTMAVLLGVWVYHHYHTRQKKVDLADDVLHICEYCSSAYLADRSKSVTQCPDCKCYNKKMNGMV